jgi:hypothetical protein
MRASSGIQTNVPEGEDGSCLIPHGHCGRHQHLYVCKITYWKICFWLYCVFNDTASIPEIGCVVLLQESFATSV